MPVSTLKVTTIGEDQPEDFSTDEESDADVNMYPVMIRHNPDSSIQAIVTAVADKDKKPERSAFKTVPGTKPKKILKKPVSEKRNYAQMKNPRYGE